MVGRAKPPSEEGRDCHRIGILIGGGDAPGLNAVIRAVVKRGGGRRGGRLLGIEDAFDGRLSAPLRVTELTPLSRQGLLPRGGTILGTTNRGDQRRFPDSPDGVWRIFLSGEWCGLTRA